MKAAPAGPPSFPTRLFIWAVTVCGLLVVGHSAVVLVRSTIPGEWMLFAILTMASGMLTLKVPSFEARFSISEAFAFASVLLFGPHVGVVTLALDAVRISFRWKMNWQQTAFNFANVGLSMWTAGTLFFLASGAAPLYHGPAPPATVQRFLALMTACYFSVNSGQTALVV
jgi:hypothetical protein